MSSGKIFRRSSWFSVLGVILLLFVFAAPALAADGKILPSTAKPKGFSLAEAAAATAYFNTGARSEDELPVDFPFQILYTPGDAVANTFHVKPGTAFYVPVVWDASPFTNQQALQNLYFDRAQYGADYVNIGVDGAVTSLKPTYAAGVQTPGLRPNIDNYSAIAAFLAPLTPGTHTVTIACRFSGTLIGGVFEFASTYTVIVG